MKTVSLTAHDTSMDSIVLKDGDTEIYTITCSATRWNAFGKLLHYDEALEEVRLRYEALLNAKSPLERTTVTLYTRPSGWNANRPHKNISGRTITPSDFKPDTTGLEKSSDNEWCAFGTVFGVKARGWYMSDIHTLVQIDILMLEETPDGNDTLMMITF